MRDNSNNNQIQTTRIEHKETAIDEASISLWLLLKASYLIAIKFQCSEPPRWADRSHGGQLPVGTMEGDLCGDVDVRQAIPVGEAKRLVAI